MMPEWSFAPKAIPCLGMKGEEHVRLIGTSDQDEIAGGSPSPTNSCDLGKLCDQTFFPWAGHTLHSVMIGRTNFRPIYFRLASEPSLQDPAATYRR